MPHEGHAARAHAFRFQCTVVAPADGRCLEFPPTAEPILQVRARRLYRINVQSCLSYRHLMYDNEHTYPVALEAMKAAVVITYGGLVSRVTY